MMKNIVMLFGFAFLGLCFNLEAKSVYDLKVKDIDGKEVSLSAYEGKVLLIANTASKCGYTNQYDDLEKIYSKYKDKGLVVMGFPANDFGGQEPGTEKEIKAFCQTRFNVSFPMFSKMSVVGTDKHELFKMLTESKKYPGEVQWNFEKFLLDRQGNLVARFPSSVKPTDPKVSKALDSLL